MLIYLHGRTMTEPVVASVSKMVGEIDDVTAAGEADEFGNARLLVRLRSQVRFSNCPLG